ncbi:helix-turn-helix domain-containing protein [Flavobacterium pedocola]
MYNYAASQNINRSLPDSLKSKSFEYFNQKIITSKNDSVKRKLYSNWWLLKAKTEKDFSQMAMAYKALIHNGLKKERIIYADSMIYAAKRRASLELIGAAYMTKGIVHYDRKEHKNALDNYLLADKYISQTDDSYNAYKIKYGIAHSKYYLGYYNEAITLFKQCLEYFKYENDRAYLNTLHSLGLCYNKTGKYKLSSSINALGIKTGLELGNNEMVPYFEHSEGINKYFLHKYPEAINKLQGSLPVIRGNKDFANETLAYLYIGKSYWSLNKKEKAIGYFKKVDAAFQKHNYTSPDIKEAYEILFGYYAQKKDLTSQLYYINKLLKVDSTLLQNFKHLSIKIHKEYDTKKLLQAKTDIEQAMRFNKAVSITVIIAMTLIIIVLIKRHYRNKRLFKELMNRTPETVNPPVKNHNNKEPDLDINPEVVSTILKSLEKFELNKKYIEKDISLIKMATVLNTNTKYLSKIIAHHRGKKFIEYINDLKTDYVVELLKNENKYRNYTNKALGEEAGFGSTQNFTRSFNNRTGISPTYFIQQLKKTCNENTINNVS